MEALALLLRLVHTRGFQGCQKVIGVLPQALCKDACNGCTSPLSPPSPPESLDTPAIIAALLLMFEKFSLSGSEKREVTP